MNKMQRAAVLTELAAKLHQEGNWGGETHLQKAAYFLQEMLNVPVEFEFILYKHGPFSFGLRDELTALQADSLLELQAPLPGYGPSYHPTDTSAELRGRFPVTLEKYARQMDFVAKAFGTKGVAELERLATALFVTLSEEAGSTVDARARRLCELKPHVAQADAAAAVEAVDRLRKDAAKITGVGG